MNPKTFLKMLIVSATLTIISSVTPPPRSPFTNQVPKRQFETCTCLQEIDNANKYTGKINLQKKHKKNDAKISLSNNNDIFKIKRTSISNKWLTMMHC